MSASCARASAASSSSSCARRAARGGVAAARACAQSAAAASRSAGPPRPWNSSRASSTHASPWPRSAPPRKHRRARLRRPTLR